MAAGLQSKLATLAGGQMHQVNDALDTIRGALIAFGIAKAKEFLTNAVPGLEHHLHEAAGSRQPGTRTGYATGSSQGSYGSGHTSGQQGTNYAPGQTSGQSGSSGMSSGSSDYRSGTQNYPGGQSSHGTGTTGRPDQQPQQQQPRSDEFTGVGSTGRSTP
jgi:hypothetical protein